MAPVQVGRASVNVLFSCNSIHKMKKSQLKSLIKECLIEILTEGLGDVSLSPPKKNSVVESKQKVQPQPRPKPSVVLKNVIENVTKDSVMQSILADTANTTYKTMLENDHGGNNAVNVEQINGSPEDIFGEENAGKWASLAFAGPVRK